MRNVRNPLIIFIMIIVLEIAFILPAFADNSMYSRQGERVYRMRNTYVLTNKGAYSAYNINVRVRIGVDSDSPYQKNVSYNIDPMAYIVKRDVAGNIYADIKIDELKAGEVRTITLDKYMTNSGIDYSDNIYDLKVSYADFLNNPYNLMYFQPAEKIESDAREIVNKLKDFQLNKNQAVLAKDIYDYVNLHIAYNTSTAYANKGALNALLTGKGVCDEYASLFTALCRAANIPSRVVYGYWVDETLNQGKWKDISGERHAWAEFYITGVGWVPAEPTLQYTYNGVRIPNPDYFANIKTDERHIITSYSRSQIFSEVNMYYSCYKDTTVELKYGEDKLMLLDKYPSSSFFSDIDDSWAKIYIDKLYASGMIFAREGNQYEPSSNITRAEFTAFLVNTLGLEADNTKLQFKDVADNHKLIQFIKAAVYNGLIKGDDEGNFRPEESISRQDAAVIMERALKLINMGDGPKAFLDFVDKNKISPYAYDSVRLIYGTNIMAGKPEKIFDPKGFTTRAETAKLLDNFINVMK